MTETATNDIEEQLSHYKSEYAATKARIMDIGFICKGSINKRWIQCGTKSCACRGDPAKRHGPYYQLSWKEKRKTRSHFLSSENVDLYKKWIENRRTFMSLIDQLEAISRKYGDCIREAKAIGRKGRKSSKTRKRTT